MNYSIGSLFDGSGGFPLAGTLCGIEPRWASEVEPYPIAVTRSRFPNMKHLGDISKVNGADVDPVDVITFGSPCQDLSTAGKQAGMKHQSNGDSETTRSGLFMEAVRIIKEMRRATNGNYPKFAVWENVPGAFSSNKGEDFRTVLNEMVKICDPTAPPVPAPEKGGWPYADCIVGNGWSIAYRVFDTQYWPGTPQRRKRIYLVADFRGERAREVLFKREGLRGYFAKGRTPWQGTAAEIAGGAGATERDNVIDRPTYILDNIGGQGEYGKLSEKNGTLRSGCTGAVAYPTIYEWHGQDSRIAGPIDVACTLSLRDGHLVMTPPVYCLQGNGIDRADTAGCNGKGWREDASYTLNTIDRPAVVYSIDQGGGKSSCSIEEETAPTLTCTHGGAPAVAHEPKEGTYTTSKASFFTRAAYERADCLVATDYKDPPIVNGQANGRYIVRRLTPTECARLQGFADWWAYIEQKDDLTDEEYRFWIEVRNTHAAINGRVEREYTKEQMLAWYNKLHSDSAEYKMWGNGIALPPSLYVMQGIAEALNDSAA